MGGVRLVPFLWKYLVESVKGFNCSLQCRLSFGKISFTIPLLLADLLIDLTHLLLLFICYLFLLTNLCMYTSNKHHTCIQETNGCQGAICVVRTLNTYLLLFNSNSLNECISVLILLFKLNLLSSQLLLQIIYLQDVYTCTCVYIIVIIEMIISQH